MKSIFDTLDQPAFRNKPAAVLGKRELSALRAWIEGYTAACEEAGEERRLETPNGLPISLLRDYIACAEKDDGTGGFDDILLRATDGQEGPAWVKFFAHLDEFEALRVQSVQIMRITDALATRAEDKMLVFSKNAEGKWEPYSYRGLVFRKGVLNEELCRITQERPDGAPERPFFSQAVTIMAQKEVDEQIAVYFGEAAWETEREADA